MTKSTITREQQRQILVDTARHIISRDNTSPYSENLREIARIALEELQERRKADSEPVAYISKSDFDAGYPHILARRDFNKACTMAVYSAQPAPVVPDDVSIFEAAIEECKTCDSIDEHAWNHGVLAVIAKYESCRAAMLAAAPKSPGSEPATVPGKWIPVSEQMPEDEQEVLTINRMGHRFVSFFDKHSGLFFDRLDAPAACCIEHVLVTHWMQLPAGPKEVK
ncbi:DUF551 domain-containing protein [Klebsiella pneumoniae]